MVKKIFVFYYNTKMDDRPATGNADKKKKSLATQ